MLFVPRRTLLFSAFLLAAGLLISPAPAGAASGTWNTLVSGTWSTTGNWVGGTIADGATFTADFSTNNITTTRTITLDSSRSIGILRFGDATSISNSTILAASGGSILTLDNAGAGASIVFTANTNGDTISAPLSLADNLTISNAGASSRVSTLSGTISAGSAGLKTITNNGTTSGVTVISGSISDGTGTVAVNAINSSSGALTLSGANNTFSGGVTLTSGILNINSATALGTGAFTITAGTINNSRGSALTLTTNNVQNWNGNFTFTGGSDLNLGTGAVTINANRTVTVSASTLTVGGGIGESGGARTFTKAGAGTLLLNGANTYSGGTTVSAGVLRFGTGAGTVSSTGNFTISANAALAATGSTGFANANQWLTSGRIVTSSAGALALVADDSTNLSFASFSSLFLGAIGNVTYSGTLTPHSTGGYRLGGGGGTLTVSSALAGTSAANVTVGLTVNGNVTLTASNHYKGATTVTAGLLNFAGLDQLGLNPSVTFSNGGGVQYATGNVVDLTQRNVTLTTNAVIDTNGNNVTLSKALLGTGTLTKSGTGMLTLESARASAGATSVINGSLRLGVSQALGSTSALTLGSGTTSGVLNLDGNDQTVTTLNVSSNSTTAVNRVQVQAGNTFTTTGNVTVGVNIAANTTTLLTVDGGGTWAASGTSIQIGGATGSANFNAATVDLTGLAEFRATLNGASSYFRMGDNANTAAGDNSTLLRLARVSTIQAAQISIGGDSGSTVNHTLAMGAVSTALYGNVIEVGAADGDIAIGNTAPRSNGVLQFNSATGTVTVRAFEGASRAEMKIVNTSSNTGNAVSGTVNLAGHEADLLLSTLSVAQRNLNNGASAATGLFIFDTGKLDATAINIGQKLAGSGTGAITGTMTIGGGDVDAGNVSVTVNATSNGASIGTLNLLRGDVDISGTLSGASHQSTANTATGTINIGGDVVVDVTTLRLAQNTSTGTPTSSAIGTLNVRGGTLNIGTGGLGLSSATTLGGIATGTLNLSGGRVNMAGDITDAGGAGTSTSAIVMTGGTLDLGGNDIVGVDTLTWSSGTLQNVATINGSAGFTKNTNGILTLSGTNTWAGDTVLRAGVTAFSSNNNLGSAGSALVLEGGALRWVTGTSTDISSQVVTLGTGGGRFDTNGNIVTLAAGIGNAGVGGLTKSGAGDLILKGANNYTGSTTFRNGFLVLDFSGSNSSAARLSTSSTLVANGGTLRIVGTEVSGQTTSQTVNGLSISQGHSTIEVSSNGGNGATLSLGAITRNAGGTVDFTPPTLGSITTTTANANFSGGSQTILGGYATVNGYTWAVSGSGSTAGAISELSTYSSSFAAGANVDVATGISTPAAMTVNSLRFNAAGATVNTAGALTIATGGILVTSNVGGSNLAINNNTLTSGNGQDLIIHQNNTAGTFTIGSSITGSIGVTKSGAGILALAGTNNFTGSLVINGGQVNINTLSSIGTAAALDADKVLINGGTLSASATVELTTNYGVQIGEKGATLQHGTNSRFTFTGVISDVAGQSGALTIKMAGGTYAGGDIVLNGANTYSGGTTLLSGVVIVNNNTTTSGGVITSGVFGTGTLTLAGGALRPGNGQDRSIGNQVILLGEASTEIANTTGAKVLSFTGEATLSGGNHTLNTASTADTIFSGSIGEDGESRTLIKEGAGRLILSGFNTYSGGTIIRAGTLQLAIAAGGSQGNADAALGGLPASSATSLTFAGSSTLQGAASATTILSATRGVVIDGGVTATLDANAGNLAILGQISGAGSLRTGTTGTVTLGNSANIYQGGTTLAGGTLIVNSDGSLGDAAGDLSFVASSVLQGIGDLNLNAGRSVLLSTGVTATLTPNGGTITVNGEISGAGNLALSSTSGTVVLAAANSYSGSTSIGGAGVGSAVLRVTHASALATTSGIFIGQTGGEDSSQLELAVTGSSTVAAPVTTVARANSVAHVQNISGTNTLTGTFTSTGSGQTTFQSDAGLMTLAFSSAANTNNIALQGSGEGVISQNLYSSGAAGGLVKNGSGTWSVTAAQTSTGATTINNGTLLANNTSGSATGSGAVIVSGGTLGGTGTVQGATLVNGTGALRPGDPGVNGGIGELTFATNLELSGAVSDTDRLILKTTAANAADYNDAVGLSAAIAGGTLSSYLSSQESFYETQEGGAHDRLTITGTLTLEENAIIRFGRVDSSSAYTYTPSFGDVFDLIDWGSLTLDGFSSGTTQRSGGLVGDLDLPTLGGGLYYDLTLFQSGGIIVVVPEPSRALLLMLGVTFLVCRRRRVR